MDKFNREGNISEIAQEAKLLELDFILAIKIIGVKRAWKVEKCTKQFAPIAVKNAKFPSNPTAQDQYTAKSALPREDPKGQVLVEEDTRRCIR